MRFQTGAASRHGAIESDSHEIACDQRNDDPQTCDDDEQLNPDGNGNKFNFIAHLAFRVISLRLRFSAD